MTSGLIGFGRVPVDSHRPVLRVYGVGFGPGGVGVPCVDLGKCMTVGATESPVPRRDSSLSVALQVPLLRHQGWMGTPYPGTGVTFRLCRPP